MCFYCHKLYMFPYAPLHGHEICPELEKINKNKLTTDKKYNSNETNKTNKTNSIYNKKIEILSLNANNKNINEII